MLNLYAVEKLGEVFIKCWSEEELLEHQNSIWSDESKWAHSDQNKQDGRKERQT